MCSIFGSVARDTWGARSDAREIAASVSRELTHRGPDDHGWEILHEDGTWSNEKSRRSSPWRMLLGMNRLSIIDLSHDGHQPMRTADGRYTIVLNGEIYNYRELRKELESAGTRFHSRTDTEVLLHAFSRWGKNCLDRLIGMFAFAVFDAGLNRLFIARDFFGIKPLFYRIGDYSFSFASEICGLLRFPDSERKMDIKKAFEFLIERGVDSDNRTMVAGVLQLPPAHYMEVDVATGTASKPRRYWKIDTRKRTDVSFREAADTVREIFLKSVRLHLRSDVPLGVALSGGIDSSAIASAIRHIEPDADLKTFSFVPGEDTEISEEKWIDIANKSVRATGHKVIVKTEEIVPDLDRLIYRLGEPFLSTSVYAQYKVYQLARSCGVTVTLDGQGADELLAGYYGYPEERMESLLSEGKGVDALRFLISSSTWSGRRKMTIVKNVIHDAFPALRRKRVFPPWMRATAFLDAGCAVNGVKRSPASIYHGRDKLRITLARQATEAGLVGLLRHGDRNSMAWSIESRVPFCDRELAEYLLSLPEEYLIDMEGRTKSVFRAAMKGLVPDEILERRDKIGFSTPEAKWLPMAVDWVEDTIDSSRGSRLLDHGILRDEWRSILDNRKPYSNAIWRWICFMRWKKLYNVSE